MSQKLGKVVPVIVNVPGRTNIEMHPGNKPADTEGCVVLGLTWVWASLVGASDTAFEALMRELQNAWNNSEVVTIEVQSVYEAGDAN
jgi:hypothetical protein